MRRNDVHPTEDEFENYLLGHTSSSSTEAIEEHLLVCGSCQAELEEAEAVVIAMRSACQELLQERAIAPRRWWQIRIPIYAYAYAGSFAVLLTVLSMGYVYRGSAPAPESELALTATRSAEQLAPFAVAGSTALLHLDTRFLPSRKRYAVELVDPSGGRVWAGEAEAGQPAITLRIGKRLNAGRYWVRLNDVDGAELREFELNVR